MDNLFELNAIDDIILDSLSDSNLFKEYSHNLCALDRLYSEPLMEEVIDNHVKLKDKVGKIIDNTKSTTKDVGTAYDQITTSNANFLKSTWDVIMQAINLLVKISTFIVNQISKIPKLIYKVLNKIMKIPSNVRNKIQGNIQLYITAKDIENLYNQSLLTQLESFIKYAEELSKGKTWNNVFQVKIVLKDGVKISFDMSDFRRCKEMKKIYNNIRRVEFTQSTIEMNNQSIINTYFGDEKSIKYIYQGHSYSSSYYDALKNLMEHLSSQQTAIKSIQDSITIKINESSANSNYGSLDLKSQKLISEAIQEIAKVTGIIGNIMKYIIQDMQTISSTADTIINKSAKTAKKLSK